ncbi:uncharacterized protein C20orf204 homolog [Sorex araneus]|uniref:uncharacterized protein C20orf204 homolog n=1 Tax=Sorex araneus TaxID=42254 RepID=UPI002433A376|nr:uncharacterized protein C20orf204 homolog [Sorex araneus]
MVSSVPPSQSESLQGAPAPSLLVLGRRRRAAGLGCADGLGACVPSRSLGSHGCLAGGSPKPLPSSGVWPGARPRRAGPRPSSAPPQIPAPGRTPGPGVGASPQPLQVPFRRVLWALLPPLLLGLGLARDRAGLRACSVPDVLRHYRGLIFEDLQAAVRRFGAGAGTARAHRKGPAGQSAGASCGAQQEHDILLSISALGRTLRGAARPGRRGALERAAWTAAARTEAAMRRHCAALDGGGARAPRARPDAPRGGRRRRLLRALDAVAMCWEKLFALHAEAEAAAAARTQPGPGPHVAAAGERGRGGTEGGQPGAALCELGAKPPDKGDGPGGKAGRP